MERTLTPEFEIELKTLLESINLKYNYDFRHYSIKSMRRTLVHAMTRLECPSLTVLQEKIIRNSQSFYDLLDSLTIPVSEMFRDPTYFLSIREKMIPILKTYPSVKIWVAGCSTGEEVYSLAILLQEEGLLESTTIYATDINQRSLAKAEAGVLSAEALPYFIENYQLSGGKHKASDYFTTDHDILTFNSTLKKNITFSDHSLATDAVFSETHFISCRNVLIYFDRSLQEKAFGLFFDSLCRRGFLGLGPQETVQHSHYAKHFEAFVNKDRLFQKK